MKKTNSPLDPPNGMQARPHIPAVQQQSCNAEPLDLECQETKTFKMPVGLRISCKAHKQAVSWLVVPGWDGILRTSWPQVTRVVLRTADPKRIANAMAYI